MSALYLFPNSVLIVLIMVMTVILSLQMLCIGYGFFVFRYERKLFLKSLLEAAILFHQFLLLLYGAETIYQMSEGFLVVRPFTGVRLGSIAAVLLLSLTVCFRKKEPQSLGAAVPALMTLPVIEQSVGAAYPLALIFCLCFWLLREIFLLYRFRKQQLSQLSSLSVKEAIDTMHFGILLFRTEKRYNGQVLLLNAQMQSLMTVLTEGVIYDGAQFLQQLSSGAVAASCKKEELAEQTVYTLPDGSVWRFDRRPLQIRRKSCVLLLASDITDQKQMTHQLYLQNRELEEKNRDLKVMLQNLGEICRTKETLRAKSQVHNILGQQISLLLRSVREQQEPDEALLEAFAENLPEQLKQAAAGTSVSLRSLVQNFESIGISVRISGALPPGPAPQRVFYEIMTEGVTNAVHHGYATEIFITLCPEPGFWTLSLTDNGTPKDAPILEGGGLSGMRRKVESLGGSFRYESRPHFSISVKIPRGDAI